MSLDDFPSLDDSERPRPPCGWLQWKRTTACIDITCQCGETFHLDNDFIYHVGCTHCGQVYEVGGYVKLYPLKHEPKGVRWLSDEDPYEQN